jgi:hopanoid biosynthesis associated radical SAM protein HpnH
MSIPFKQKLSVGTYVLKQKLLGNKRYPLVLMLEPLFQCNLACAGCGKIDYPEDVLAKRLSVAECMEAVDECGAPVVSIPGGEPLLHKEMPEIVRGIVARKKFVYLCTNALLLKKRMDDYTPSPYLTFSVHLDGERERHDEAVCQEGVFDRAVEAIQLALARGFRVSVNCTLFDGETPERVAAFLDHVVELGVEATTISPGFSYERAPQQHVFLQRQATRQLFRDVFKLGTARRGARKWKLNHSSLYLDFLAGNQDYQCSPWGSPARNVFGWQKPCYLMADEGYATSFAELMEDTPWEKYGSSKHPKCAQCMAHCGYEPTAVNAVMANPLKAAWVALRGPRTEGPMVDNDVPAIPVGVAREHPVHFFHDVSRAGSGLQAQVSPNKHVLVGDPEAVGDPALK